MKLTLTEDEKNRVKDTLSELYRQVPDTGYNMGACWKKDGKGNITGTVDLDCLRNGGKAIGQEIKNLWGK